MHPATRARLAAALLAAAALALWPLGHPGPAIVLSAAAAAVALIVPDRAVTQDVARALADDRTIADAVSAMRLEGRGVIAPWAGGAVLFAPAGDTPATDVPTFDGATRIVSRPAGMFLTPPGQGLLDAWVAYHGPVRQGGVPQATAVLQRALPGLGVGDKVHVEVGPTVRITYRPTFDAGSDATRAWAAIGGDAVASFTGLVLCLATGRAWQLVARDEVAAGIRVEWA